MDRPLTVAESLKGRVPETLERVVSCIEKEVGVATHYQLIAGLFFVLMQECGFMLIQPAEPANSETKPSELEFVGNEKRTMTFNHKRSLLQAPLVTPLVTTSSREYRMSFKLVGVQDYRFKLILSPSAEDLMTVNLLVTKEDYRDLLSYVLKVSTFVPKPKAEIIANKFSDLRTLSIIFKDNIAHIARSNVLNAEGVVNNSFLGLMDEVKNKIVSVLSVKDLLNLSATCQTMLAKKMEIPLWRKFILRDFGYVTNKAEERSVEDLIELYKTLKKKKETSINRRRFEEDYYSYDGSVDSSLDYTPDYSRDSSYEFHPYFIPVSPSHRNIYVMETDSQRSEEYTTAQ